MTDLVPSLLMLAALGLIAGAVAGWRRGIERKKLVLMVAAATVMLGNVAIWTIPNQRGDTLTGAARATAR